MKEVASLLHISPRTAESHKYAIMDLLGAQNYRRACAACHSHETGDCLEAYDGTGVSGKCGAAGRPESRLELIAQGAPLPKDPRFVAGCDSGAMSWHALLDPSAGPRRDSRAARRGAGPSGGISSVVSTANLSARELVPAAPPLSAASQSLSKT